MSDESLRVVICADGAHTRDGLAEVIVDRGAASRIDALQLAGRVDVETLEGKERKKKMHNECINC